MLRTYSSQLETRRGKVVQGSNISVGSLSSPRHHGPGRQFARAALWVFVLGSATVLAFAIAERSGLISKFYERTARLAVCGALLAYFVVAARWLPQRARLAVYLCSTLLFAGTSL